jgi:non-specific serine/threonine protein kinase
VRALHGASWLARDSGDYRRATELAHECLALARESGDHRDAALASDLLGYVALAEGDYDRAAAHARAAQALFGEQGNHWLAAATQTDLAMAAYGRGDLAKAAALLEDALARFRALGDAFYPQLILVYLGLVACDRGDPADAAARFAASLPLWRRVGARDWSIQWLAGVATLAAVCGAPERAARLFGAAEALRDAVGIAFVLPERASFARGRSAARGALGEAAFAVAAAAGAALPLEPALDEAAAYLSAVATPTRRREPNDPIGDAGLTLREAEVLCLIAEGKTDRQIAELLFVQRSTARRHVANLYDKLGVHNRAEATRFALEHGLCKAAQAASGH